MIKVQYTTISVIEETIDDSGRASARILKHWMSKKKEVEAKKPAPDMQLEMGDAVELD